MTDQDATADTGPRYEWRSSGGCERCDALDGHLCEEPSPRPHPNCDCRILDRTRPARSCDSSDLRYDLRYSGNLHHGGGYDDDEEFDLVFDYLIVCWGNAQRITGEIVVSRRYRQLREEPDVDAFFEDAYAEALEKVEHVAASECPPCGSSPPVS